MKEQSNLKRLLRFVGGYKYLTIASWVLSALSALVALMPFVYIWKVIKEVLDVAPDYGAAQNLADNGWMAVLFAVAAILVYVAALLCSHLAAFRVQANIRMKAMHHIVTLPMGFMDSIGSGKIRKAVYESSGATETYLAHQLPDKANALATPVGLLVLLLVFDWRLGLLSLLPIAAALVMTSGGVTNEFLLNLMYYIIITPIITLTLTKIMYASENKLISKEELMDTVSFGILLLTSGIMKRSERRVNKAQITCADGIQECLEAVRDLKANNAENEYIKGLDAKIKMVEKQTVVSELPHAVCNTSFLISGIP